jgi:ribose-phosphate pyrophosphokinase
MELTLLGGSAAVPLTRAIAAALAIEPAARTVERLPLRGADVFVVQGSNPPAESHLLELLFLVDGCRRAGADRITAVIPYLAYARQDRVTTGREALGARIVADVLATARVDRALVIDHPGAIESCRFPVEQLTAVPLLAEAIRTTVSGPAVIVAPDGGAVRLADHYARCLDLPVAAVQRLRVSGTDVKHVAIAGDVAGRVPIVVDDMINTGRTLKTAADALLSARCLPQFVVAATHGLFAAGAGDTLRHVPIQRLVTTDTLPQPERSFPVDVISVAALVADAVRRLNREKSMES